MKNVIVQVSHAGTGSTVTHNLINGFVQPDEWADIGFRAAETIIHGAHKRRWNK